MAQSMYIYDRAGKLVRAVSKLRLITAPSLPVLTTGDSLGFMGNDRTDVNNVIDRLTATAVATAESRLGIALMPQTWEIALDAFPVACAHNSGRPWDNAIVLPKPPLISVASIIYIDTTGATQTYDSSLYTVDDRSTPARIVPAYGTNWLATRAVPNAVVVQFTCGYGNPDASAPVDPVSMIPDTTKTAMLQLIAHWYDNPEMVAADRGDIVLPEHMQMLLDLNPHRIVKC